MSHGTDLPDVMKEWTLPMLNKASDSSVLLHRLVTVEMKRRVHVQLQRYFQYPDQFLDLLYATKSIISGSTVLGLVYPKYLPFVGDLDIYVASDGRTVEMVAMLTKIEGVFA